MTIPKLRRNVFGTWLIDELTNRGMSLRAFGRRSGISQASLSRWTKLLEPAEKPELPSRNMVVKLAKALSYKSATIQTLVDQAWADWMGARLPTSDLTSLSPEARLFAERFDKLPKVVRNALWRAAFGEEALGDGE